MTAKAELNAMSRADVSKLRAKVGSEIAGQALEQNLTYSAAIDFALCEITKELATLKYETSQLQSQLQAALAR